MKIKWHLAYFCMFYWQIRSESAGQKTLSLSVYKTVQWQISLIKSDELITQGKAGSRAAHTCSDWEIWLQLSGQGGWETVTHNQETGRDVMTEEWPSWGMLGNKQPVCQAVPAWEYAQANKHHTACWTGHLLSQHCNCASLQLHCLWIGHSSLPGPEKIATRSTAKKLNG